MTLSRAFPAVPASVADARSFTRRTLGGEPPELVEMAVLLVSELSTTAVHTADAPFQVSIERTAPGIRVQVRDEGLRRGGGYAGPCAASRRILDAVSAKWGVDRGDHAVATWFLLTDRAVAR